jgi:hypothetical protein
MVLIIDKTGIIKALTVKSLDESTLYKKAGFKNDTGFKCHTTWVLELDEKKYSISLYGKKDWLANQ